MESFANSFSAKRVLVTGHTGFKGSWLALWLHELGAEVTGLALRPNTTPSHFDLLRLGDLIRHIEGDIRSPEDVGQAFARARPEIVFHLAAQALVRPAYLDPKGTFDTNIGGTVNVLEAVRTLGSVQAVVVITSDKCYENREWVWGYRENDALGGHDPYSASKGAAEIVCAAYRRSFFDAGGQGPPLGLATARAGNVIGGGDWAQDRLIPDCVRALSSNTPVVIRNPHATRPWQHVLDPLSGYLLLAQRLLDAPQQFAGAWNFGPAGQEQITVGALAERFAAAWGSGRIETPTPDANAPHEAHLLQLAIDKAVRDLHWSPSLSAAQAIEWTVAWYQAWHHGAADLRNVSSDQLREYMRLSRR
jgi:CDP-glucose 4,6-dehydratase